VVPLLERALQPAGLALAKQEMHNGLDLVLASESSRLGATAMTADDDPPHSSAR